jgi:hypothetical protein
MIAKARGCKAAPVAGLSALAIIAALVSMLPLLPARAAAPDAQAVTLSITNESSEPLRCQIMFAHFVVTEAGAIPPGGNLAIALSRQDSDGALWIARADGRRMMIETIDCGASARWAEARGQIPLLPARAGREARYGTTCRFHDVVNCEDLKPLRFD